MNSNTYSTFLALYQVITPALCTAKIYSKIVIACSKKRRMVTTFEKGAQGLKHERTTLRTPSFLLKAIYCTHYCCFVLKHHLRCMQKHILYAHALNSGVWQKAVNRKKQEFEVDVNYERCQTGFGNY